MVIDTSPLLSEGVDEADDATNGSEGLGRSSGSIFQIAQETGLTEHEVRDNNHDAKRHLPKSTGHRNPDVVVDLDTGEIYPDGPGNTYGDSIGNIYD